MEEALACCTNSPEYTAARKIRQTVSEGEFVLVEGVAHKPRRSALFVPAANGRALEKARGLAADVIILTWKTRSAPQEKEKDAACARAVDVVRGFAPRETVISGQCRRHALACRRPGSRGQVGSRCHPAAQACGPGRNRGGTARRQRHGALGDDRDPARPAQCGDHRGRRRGMPAFGQQRHDPCHGGPPPRRSRQSSAPPCHSVSWRRGPPASGYWTGCTTISTRRRIMRRSCAMARDFGFDGKSVHPSQPDRHRQPDLLAHRGRNRLCQTRAVKPLPPIPARYA